MVFIRVRKNGGQHTIEQFIKLGKGRHPVLTETRCQCGSCLGVQWKTGLFKRLGPTNKVWTLQFIQMITIYTLNYFAKNQTAILFSFIPPSTPEKEPPLWTGPAGWAYLWLGLWGAGRQVWAIQGKVLRKKSDLWTLMTTLCKSHKGRTSFFVTLYSTK